jgi:hypothetical protein
MMIINTENLDLAVAAIRDILYMYYDLIASYRGFGHNIDTGEFDPMAFLTCSLEVPAGQGFGLDLELLHEGAAIAILCDLSDSWDERDGPTLDWPRLAWAQQQLSSGAFSSMPTLERAVRLGFEGTEDDFRHALEGVYGEYVIGLFNQLVAEPGHRVRH